MPRKRKAQPVKTPERPADIPILPDDHVRVFGPPDDEVGGPELDEFIKTSQQVAFVAGITYAALFLRRNLSPANDLAAEYSFSADDLAEYTATLRTLR